MVALADPQPRTTCLKAEDLGLPHAFVVHFQSVVDVFVAVLCVFEKVYTTTIDMLFKTGLGFSVLFFGNDCVES
jgi:hypothetical protein